MNESFHSPPLAPLSDVTRPLAITMWDFSWLERRWPGAGYENWDMALDGLFERGYDAVRVDAYPHLLDAGTEREWDIEVLWTVQDWGSPAPIRVLVWPANATSNFCGPQFRGMWRDFAWHQRLTQAIKLGKLSP